MDHAVVQLIDYRLVVEVVDHAVGFVARAVYGASPGFPLRHSYQHSVELEVCLRVCPEVDHLVQAQTTIASHGVTVGIRVARRVRLHDLSDVRLSGADFRTSDDVVAPVGRTAVDRFKRWSGQPGTIRGGEGGDVDCAETCLMVVASGPDGPRIAKPYRSWHGLII